MAISIPLRAEAGTRRRRLVMALLAAASIVVTAAGLHRLSNSVVFDVREVSVQGAAYRSTAEVLARAAIAPGTSAIWLDEGAVERRIERDPWVGDATVTTSLPGAVGISVVERTAVATVLIDGSPTLLAVDGTLLGPAPAGAPLVRVEDRSGRPEAFAGAAAAIGAMPPALFRDVHRVTIESDGSLEVRLADGATVRYGAADDLDLKASSLVRVLHWADREGLDLQRISVVAPSDPSVVTAV